MANNKGGFTPRKTSNLLSHKFAISLLLSLWFLYESVGVVHSQFITHFQTSGFPQTDSFGGNRFDYTELYSSPGFNPRPPSNGFTSGGGGSGSSSHATPPSPCPQTFQYQSNGFETIGSGTLQPGQYQIGQDILLMAQLIVGVQLPSSYYGKLKLSGSPEQIVNQMYSNEPIQFEIEFPTQNPLPVISAILVNGNPICSADPLAQPNFSYFTKVTLQYMFKPVVSANFRPRPSSSFGQTPPQQRPNTNNGFNGGSGSGQQPNQFQPPQNNFNYPQQTTPSYAQGQQPGDRFGSPVTDSINLINTDHSSNNNLQGFVRPHGQQSAATPEPPRPPIRTTIQSTPRPAPNYELGCGRIPKEYTPLVFGGQTLTKGDWPFVAALHHYVGSSLKFKCGATIISKSTVISAAHCFYNNKRRLNAEDVLAFMGHFNLKRLQEDGSRIVNLASVIVHPDYNTNNGQQLYSDIAIGKLSETVEFSEFIQPACLWSGSPEQNLIVGRNGIIVGWGLDESGQQTAEPKKVGVPIVSDQKCLRSHEAFGKITSDRTFCAGWRNGSEGPCNGDSGSGLMLNQDGMWYLRGLVSTSLVTANGGCNLDEFVVFTDVARFTSWIMTLL